jgi:hypothetical protein
MTRPSTEWREQIGSDETVRYEGYARAFAGLQKRRSEKFGKGRALHRKQVLGLPATLEVQDGLPGYARHGLFALTGTHPAWVRLSNGSSEIASDRKPDVHGFSIKVLGIQGPGALGVDTDCQDILLNNTPVFAFPNSDEFVGLVLALSSGGGALLKHLLGRYGFLGALKTIKRLGASLKKPFPGYAAETFYSAVPFACGPYAMKMRLLPPQADLPAATAGEWSSELLGRLQHDSLTYTLQAQFFVSEAQTPIEDPSVEWPESIAPYITVAKLILSPHEQWASQVQTLRTQIEAAAFDPWRALVEHRPLGEINRARKAIYFESQKNR